MGSEADDVQQRLVFKEEFPPEQQNCSPSMDQEDHNLPQIKEEQEEADVTGFIFSPVSVKSEDDEEKPQCSELHLNLTEEDRHSVEPELHLNQYWKSDFKDETSDSSETDVSDGNWEESCEHQSGFNSVRNDDIVVGDSRCESSEKICSCTKCGKIFKHKSSLVRHIRIHTGEKPFSCSDCKATFAFKYCLVYHMKMHNRETSYSCSVCKAAFLFKYRLVRHMRVHTRKESYSCTVCGKTFSRKNCLISHMRCHTEPKNCPICGDSFVHRSNLTSHIRLHTGEKPFSCSICQAAFNRKHSLELHMKTHSGDEPFICPICQATFKWRATFERHTRTHCGKPFSCSVCKAAFRKKMHYMDHMRSHKDIQQLLVSKHEFPPEQQIWSSRLDQPDKRPLQVKEKHKLADITDSTVISVYKFKADEEKPQSSELHLNQTQENRGSVEEDPEDQYLESHLENKFLISPDNSGSDLLRHNRINAGEKPFSCSICKTTFKLRTSLVLHTKTHSGVKPFSCSVCKVAFLTKYTLLQHTRTHTEQSMFGLKQKLAWVSVDKAHQHFGSGKD